MPGVDLLDIRSLLAWVLGSAGAASCLSMCLLHMFNNGRLGQTLTGQQNQPASSQLGLKIARIKQQPAAGGAQNCVLRYVDKNTRTHKQKKETTHCSV